MRALSTGIPPTCVEPTASPHRTRQGAPTPPAKVDEAQKGRQTPSWLPASVQRPGRAPCWYAAPNWWLSTDSRATICASSLRSAPSFFGGSFSALRRVHREF